MVTSVPEVCVAVTTADCVPVLLYAPDQMVVAAIHAGWRGTVADIVGKTVAYMQEQYNCKPELMKAVVAPCIHAEAFEVGEEVAKSFESLTNRMPGVAFIHPVTHKYHPDLPEINRLLLLERGLSAENIEVSPFCTYTHNDSFYSARKQGIRSGRMLTGILKKQ